MLGQAWLFSKKNKIEDRVKTRWAKSKEEFQRLQVPLDIQDRRILACKTGLRWGSVMVLLGVVQLGQGAPWVPGLALLLMVAAAVTGQYDRGAVLIARWWGRWRAGSGLHSSRLDDELLQYEAGRRMRLAATYAHAWEALPPEERRREALVVLDQVQRAAVGLQVVKP